MGRTLLGTRNKDWTEEVAAMTLLSCVFSGDVMFLRKKSK